VCHDAFHASFCPFGAVVCGGTAHPNTMLVYRVQKILLSTYRSTLAAKIKRLGATIIVLCTLYARAYTLYMFSGDSFKCSKCTHKGVTYDGNFSKADFDKL
jgi:hypothetical protein